MGRQLKNEAESLMESIEQITLREMESLREQIAQLKEQIEELRKGKND